MKRLFAILLFVLAPVALYAQTADRDVLVTADGTLYTIESMVNEGGLPSAVSRYLLLTIQKGTERPQALVVPDSLSAGLHWRPALAFDPDSKTLFVFWLKMPTPMSCELMLASYSNGRWQPAVSVDNQSYVLRLNLRISITRRVTQVQRDGPSTEIPATLVHAVWWEETGVDETARYALFVIDKGVVSSVEMHGLAEFAATPGFIPADVAPNFNPEILRHPVFLDNGTSNSVDVVFGDVHLNTFNRVTLKPIADGRMHIPIGAHPGGPHVPAPYSFSSPWNGQVSAIASHDGKLLFYNTTANEVDYIMYDGAWSSVKVLPLNEKLTADAAVAALSRMINGQ